MASLKDMWHHYSEWNERMQARAQEARQRSAEAHARTQVSLEPMRRAILGYQERATERQARARVKMGEAQAKRAGARKDDTVLVRVYKGKHMERDFQQEARQLQHAGWIPGDPSYSGLAREGVGQIFLWGVAGKRRAASMTVVYTRTQSTPASTS